MNKPELPASLTGTLTNAPELAGLRARLCVESIDDILRQLPSVFSPRALTLREIRTVNDCYNLRASLVAKRSAYPGSFNEA